MKIAKWVAIALASALVVWGVHLSIVLAEGRSQPVDTFLVLGGSIQREIHMAEHIVAYPQTKVLISTGSDPPCIRILFERINAPIHQVWLENCARSTFGNFRFSLPILQQWSTRHLRLVTSAGHLPRALWMARLMLGAHGVWVEPEIVYEEGVPGNRESWVKTILDLTRGLMWTGVSYVYKPLCSEVMPLGEVDLATWQANGFHCEHQADIDPTGF